MLYHRRVAAQHYIGCSPHSSPTIRPSQTGRILSCAALCMRLAETMPTKEPTRATPNKQAQAPSVRWIRSEGEPYGTHNAQRKARQGNGNQKDHEPIKRRLMGRVKEPTKDDCDHRMANKAVSIIFEQGKRIFGKFCEHGNSRGHNMPRLG